jgi:hypothetical protein
MQVWNNKIFDSGTTNENLVGSWFNTAQLGPDKSFHVIGLEDGGSLEVYASNSGLYCPPVSPTDPTSVSILTIQGTGDPIIAPLSSLVAWVQIQKTSGATPTETTVRMLGHTF